MEELVEIWGGVVSTERDSAGKALVAGRRIRIHVGQLLRATWLTLKAVGSGLEVPANPLAILKLGVETFAAASGALSAVQESLSAVEFMACVALGAEKDGIDEEELSANLAFLCDEVPVELFPWWLGIDRTLLAKARLGVQPPNTVKHVVEALEKRGLVERRSTNKLIFMDRAMVWQLT
jgi:hypothetical protein